MIIIKIFKKISLAQLTLIFSNNCVVTVGLTLGFGEPKFNDKFNALPLTKRPAAAAFPTVAGLSAEFNDAVLELICGFAYGEPVGLKFATGPLTSAYDTFKHVPDEGSSMIFDKIMRHAFLLFSLSPIIVMQRSWSVKSFGFCEICTYDPLSSFICLM